MAERKSVLLRINPELWKELQRMSEQEFRSINSQIEFLLKEAVAKRRGKSIETQQEEEVENP